MRNSVVLLGLASSLLSRVALAQAPAPPEPAALPPAAPAPAAPPVVAQPVAPEAAAQHAPGAAAAAQVPADPAAPVAPQVSAPPAEPATAAGAEPVLPAKVAVGKRGYFQPSAQLQFWAYAQSQKVADEHDFFLGFRLRRAELRVKGEIVPKLFGYNVMIDPSRALEFDSRYVAVAPADPAAPSGVTVAQPNGPTTILQDVILTFQSDYADVSVGQFKLPIGYEAYNSTAKLIMPEFALVTRYYSARRDIGIKVDKKLGKHFYYRVDVLNGAGQNRLENDDQKDGALRLEAYPTDGVVIGAVGYAGLNQRNDSATKDRVEADLKVDVANVLVQGEYIHGWDGATGDDDPDRTEGHGFYAAAGYTFAKKLQPLVRVGYLNPHIGTEVATPTATNDRVWSYEAGANYFIEGYDLELQLSAGVFDYEHVNSVYHGIFEVQVNF